MPLASRSELVLAAVLHAVKPLVRMLLRHGVAYPAFSAALKHVFLQSASDELRRTGRKETGSAISLLSGVHRRDVRNLSQVRRTAAAQEGAPMNMAAQVVARWISELEYLDEHGTPRALQRAGPDPGFDALVASISRDVRPRAVLDELVRLGIALEEGGTIRLVTPGFVPHQGFEEMIALLQDNLHDHAAAAVRNLDDGAGFLEQALFSDQLTAESVLQLHAAAARVWRDALKGLMRQARQRFDHDQAHASPEQRVHRIRFGAYFHATDEDDPPA